jgi:hypothetical protein
MQTRDGTTYFVEKISGLWVHYNLGNGHPVIGRSAPDFEFEDGTRLGALLHEGKGVLLDLAQSKELSALGQAWKLRLKYVSANAKDSLGLTAVLVRPDGFVAWATESEPDVSAATQSIERWFGSAM